MGLAQRSKKESPSGVYAQYPATLQEQEPGQVAHRSCSSSMIPGNPRGAGSLKLSMP